VAKANGLSEAAYRFGSACCVLEPPRGNKNPFILISPHFRLRLDAMTCLKSRHDVHTLITMRPNTKRRLLMIAALAWALPAKAQPVIPPGLLDYAASALGGLIDNARQQAIADGVRPIPPSVYRSLLGYFPADLLQRCRFATGSSRALTLPALAFTYGDATAITLGDVILFKADRVAETDLKVWAHELTHVMQYQRWGVDGFAERYVRDSTSVEQEAIDNANRFFTWHNHHAVR
jgi:hypothetical protein